MLTLLNLKTDFSIVEDQEGTPYAIDHKKYPNIPQDDPSREYEIHPIKKNNNYEGEVLYESIVKLKRRDLTPRFSA